MGANENGTQKKCLNKIGLYYDEIQVASETTKQIHDSKEI